jgi:hypothetical protein
LWHSLFLIAIARSLADAASTVVSLRRLAAASFFAPSLVLPATPLSIWSSSSRVQGFDEYMNLVLDDASELDVKRKSRKPLGRIMLKGENITAIFNAPTA